MTNTRKTAIVILNWNGAHLFSEFLPSVIRHSLIEGVIIYVADNGSTDNSVDYLREHFPVVNIISLKKNFGFAKGYNLALQQIEADYYVLLNSDVEVTPGWLIPCIQRLESQPEMAALQPKVLSYARRHQFEYAGAAGGFIDRWGFPFCRGRILSETEDDHGQYDQPVSLFWATGACMVIRARVFHENGGFDDDFFAHMEEIDLCWRLKNKGWQIGLEPAGTVYHLGGATLSYFSPQKVYLNFRNNLWMLLKNLPENKVVQVLFFRMLLDGVAAIHFLLSGKVHAFRSVFNAHITFWKNLYRFVEKRRQLLPGVTKNMHPEIFKGSMVYRFYIKKQRKFSEFKFSPLI
jgi:GT2 family glycosyltransferase